MAVEFKGNPEDVIVVQLRENMRRANPCISEKSDALASVIRDLGWTQARMALELGISRSTMSKILAIQKAPDEVRKKLDAGEMTFDAAAQLAKVKPEVARRIAQRPGRITSKDVARIKEEEGIKSRRRTSEMNFEVQGGSVTVKLQRPDAKVEHFMAALENIVRAAGVEKTSQADNVSTNPGTHRYETDASSPNCVLIFFNMLA